MKQEKTMGCGGVLCAFIIGALVLALIVAGGPMLLLYALALAVAGGPITGVAVLVIGAILAALLTYDSHQAQQGLDQ